MSYTDPEPVDNRLFNEPVYVDETTKYRRLAPSLVLFVPILVVFPALLWVEGDMLSWAVSGPRLAEGKIGPILLHMFAHAGLVHIVFNLGALIALGPAVMERLGPLSTRSATAFFVLYFGSGLSGMLLWLAFNWTSVIPMLGASGAIFGFLGFLICQPDPQKPPFQLSAPQLRQSLWTLLKEQFVLVAMFALPFLFGSGFMGLAWESHLGGFVAGVLLGRPLWKFAGGRPDWVFVDEWETP